MTVECGAAEARIDPTGAPAIEGRAGLEVTDAAWDSPKIGIVSVDGIGGACLPRPGNLTQILPFISRTIAIEISAIELSFMEADRKLLVGDGQTLLS